MPRKARVVEPGTAHHVVQRGNYKQIVFERDKDYRTYLYLVRKNAPAHQLKIHSFCLMNNHVHLIVTPREKNNLSEFFRTVHAGYSQYKNLHWQRSGQLWQGRYFSCVLSPGHLFRAIRYVELNPVRAKLVKQPWQYIWSSARQHLQMETNPIVRTDFQEDCRLLGVDQKDWGRYLSDEDDDMIRQMRACTRQGKKVEDPADTRC